MDGERIVTDDACAPPSQVLLDRLDSGFQSGGSLSSCHHQPANVQHTSSAAVATTKQDVYSRQYNREDSGLCVQFSNTLDISDDPKSVVVPSPAELSGSSSQQQQQYSNNPSAFLEMFYGVDADGDTQLHLAIADGATEIVSTLIRRAPDPSFLDIQNNEMYAPLHISVLVNQPAMVRGLVVAGAATDIRDREGNTPLHLAAKRGHRECAEALLTSISTQELKDSVIPQRHSTHQHSPSTLLNLKNYNGEHCIHLATFGQHYDLIWFLNLQQADVSSLEGRSGKTALHYAVNMGDQRLVRLLAYPKEMGGCGVWLNARDWAGRTALQCAMINGDHNIANILMDLPGCDKNLDESSDEDFEFDTEDEEIICEKDYNDIEVNGIRYVNSIA